MAVMVAPIVVVPIMVVVVMVPVAAADVMVVALLRRPGVAFVADDLRAVFAQLAVHYRVAVGDLGDPLDKGV